MTSDACGTTKARRMLMAGLVTSLPLIMAPEVALAATVGDVAVAATASGIAGAALGALVVGGVGHVLHARQRRELEQLVARLAHDGAPKRSEQPVAEVPASETSAVVDAASAPVVEAPVVESKLELIDSLPREPLQVVEPVKSDSAAAEPVDSTKPTSGRRNLDSLPDPFAEPAPDRRADAPAPTAIPMADEVPATPVPETVVPKVDPSGAVPFVPSVANPYVHPGKRSKGGSRRKAPAALVSDYESVASDYMARKSFKKRMTLTAKGVAAVLGERMGRNMMDGLPVIERADGSVGDLGTTWWERDQRSQRQAPEQVLASSSAFSRETLQARATDVSAATPVVPVAQDAPIETFIPSVQAVPAAVSVPVAPSAPMASPVSIAQSTPTAQVAPTARPIPANQAPDAEERSRLIVSRIAPIEEAYPEIGRSWHDPADDWESALAAMDNRVEDNLVAGREERLRRRQARLAASVIRTQEVVVASVPAVSQGFADAVGNIDTIDEPDGLERDTQFLNFRAPGNHPEVHDTASYINYLIEDEFKRNPSSRVRHHARSFLRVHEGGQNTRAQAM